MISRKPLGTGIEVKARKHYDGLNTSSVIGFIETLPADSPLEFKVIPEEKIAIVGGENTLPGSGGSHISVAIDPGFQSKPGQPEPVFCPCFASNARIGDASLLQP